MADSSNPYDHYRDIAFHIGAKLARDAVWHDHYCSWIGYNLEYRYDKVQVFKEQIGTDIATGNAGILQFLDRLHEHIPDPIIHKLILGTRNKIKFSVNESLSNPGYFIGDLGRVISLIQTSDFEEDESHLNQYTELLLSLLDFEIPTTSLQVYNGLAGMIAPLIHIQQSNPHPIILRFLTNTLNYIVSQIESADLYNYQKTGYGHSIHGILAEALRLALYIDNKKAVQQLIDAIDLSTSFHGDLIDRWKQSHNIQEVMNHTSFEPYSTGWLDGLAGNLRSIILQYQLTENEQCLALAHETSHLLCAMTEEILNRNDWYANYSFNHGLAGIGTILIQSGQILENKAYSDLAFRIAEHGKINIYQHDFDWPSGLYAPEIYGAKPTYGLHTGVAGTGMFYLELLDLEPATSPE